MTDIFKECTCEAFKKSFHQIIEAQLFSFTHGGKYTGDRFNYCPWCGEKLEEENDAETKK